MDNRTDDQRARGIIPARINGAVREMPTLKVTAARPWKQSLAAAVKQAAAVDIRGSGGGDSMADVVGLGVLIGDTVLDLLLTYDVTAALGGREYLEANADDAQLYGILRSCVEVHFPFVEDATAATGTLARLIQSSPAGPSAPESSPSGASPTGD